MSHNSFSSISSIPWCKIEKNERQPEPAISCQFPAKTEKRTYEELENENARLRNEIEAKREKKIQKTFSFHNEELVDIFLQKSKKLFNACAPIKIEVPINAEGNSISFEIPKLALMNVSPTYQKNIYNGCDEKKLIWIKESHNGNDYFHSKAASQVVLYANSTLDLDNTKYASISQLLSKSENSSEKERILYDIYVLADLYQIKALTKECEEYFIDEMSQSPSHWKEAFHYLFSFPSTFQIEEVSCKSLDRLTEEKEVLNFDIFLEILSFLKILGKKERSFLELKRQDEILFSLRKCFEILICKFEKQKSSDFIILNELCETFLILYPSFDLSDNFIPDLYSWLSKTAFSLKENPLSFAMCSWIKGIYDVINDSEVLALLESTDLKIKEIGLMIKAFDLNNKSSEAELFKNNGILEVFNQIFQLNPANIFMLKYRADMYFELRAYQKAITDYSTILAINPCHVEALHFRGDCQSHLGQDSLALKDYDSALAIAPLNTEVLQLRGELLFKTNLFDAAIVDFTAILPYVENKENILLTRGKCYMNLKNYAAAVKDFNEIKTEKGKELLESCLIKMHWQELFEANQS